MLETLQQAFSDSDLWPLYSLLVVACAERCIRWPEHYHPLTLLRLLALRMADKVNSSSNALSNQAYIAGSLAPLVLLSPFLLIIAILLYFAEYPIFFDSLLLFLAIGFEPYIKTARKVQLSLRHDKKILARQQLLSMVRRQTDQLSPFGMAKACVESLLLRYSHQYCTVILLYLCAGGLAAFSYRCVYELSHCWNTRLQRFRLFGQPVAVPLRLLQWLPARISGACFILAHNVSGGLRALAKPAQLMCSHNFLLALMACSMGIQLGGPAYYNSDKSQLAKFGPPQKVQIAHIEYTIAVLRRSQWILLSLCIVISLLLNLE